MRAECNRRIPVEFEVPSGAFFIIKSEVFSDVGGFDERTFLYGEELILGHKMRSKSLRFLYCPEIRVFHKQGVTTGWQHGRPSRAMYAHQIASLKLYAEQYLGASRLRLAVLRLTMELGYSVRVADYFRCRIRNVASTILNRGKSA